MIVVAVVKVTVGTRLVSWLAATTLLSARLFTRPSVSGYSAPVSVPCVDVRAVIHFFLLGFVLVVVSVVCVDVSHAALDPPRILPVLVFHREVPGVLVVFHRDVPGVVVIFHRDVPGVMVIFHRDVPGVVVAFHRGCIPP